MIGTKKQVLGWVMDQPGKMFEVKEHKEKRSLDQNAYFHKLVGLIAKSLRLSDTEVKNRLISDYGVVDTDMKYMIVDDEAPIEKFKKLHLKPTASTKVLDNGRLYRVCYVMKGSHELDTSDMSRLLDGAIQEAKQLGIETLPPRELERMREEAMSLQSKKENPDGNMEANPRV